MNRFQVLLVAVMLTFAGTKAATMEKKYPYVVVLGDSVHGVDMSDSLFYRISRKVGFAVNKYTIPQNSAFRKELISEIIPHFNNKEYALEALMVRGAASPEGPYEWNKTLSALRSKALVNLVKQYSDYPVSDRLSVTEVPEDYLYLLMLMKERGDRDYRRVAAVVDKYIATDQQKLKAKLMAMDAKSLWRRLLKEYFPEMRAARVVLFFKKYEGVEPKPISGVQIGEGIGRNTALDVPGISVDITPELRLPRREVLSVKTNLLFDFAYVPGYDRFCPIPNIAVEYYPLHGHFTFGASFDCPWWQHYSEHKYFQVRNYQLEARYYFRNGGVEHTGYGNGAAYKGWYLSGYANMGLFGVCFDANRGWEGEGVGGGLGFGYVLPLTRKGHWRLEFGAQLGVFFTKYDPYQYESVLYPERHDDLYYYKWDMFGNLFKRRQHAFTWFGPTRVGITLTYDLLYRRRAKSGVSLKSWEALR